MREEQLSEPLDEWLTRSVYNLSVFEDRRVLVVAIIGKECRQHSKSQPINAFLQNNVFLSTYRRNQTSSTSIDAFYAADISTVFLRLNGYGDVEALEQAFMKPTQKTDNGGSGFFERIAVLERDYIRALTFLLCVSHVLLHLEPCCRFDLTLCQFLKKANELRLSVREELCVALGKLSAANCPREWAIEGRLARPRLLFAFHRSPLRTDLGAVKRKELMTKLEQNLENQIFNVLRLYKLIAHSNKSYNCVSIPCEGTPFVYVFTQNRDDSTAQDYIREMVSHLILTTTSSSSDDGGAGAPGGAGAGAAGSGKDTTGNVNGNDLETGAAGEISGIVKKKRAAAANTAAFSEFSLFLKGSLDEIRHEPDKGVVYEVPKLKAFLICTKLIYDRLMMRSDHNGGDQRVSLLSDDQIGELSNIELQFMRMMRPSYIGAAKSTYTYRDARELEKCKPLRYTKREHQIKLQRAIEKLEAVYHGSDLEKAKAELIEECEAIWATQKACEQISLTGNECTQPVHAGPETVSVPASKRTLHSSAARFLSTCNCGHSQLLRNDPFTLKEANFDFYQAPQFISSCCSELESYKFAVFEVTMMDVKMRMRAKGVVGSGDKRRADKGGTDKDLDLGEAGELGNKEETDEAGLWAAVAGLPGLVTSESGNRAAAAARLVLSERVARRGSSSLNSADEATEYRYVYDEYGGYDDEVEEGQREPERSSEEDGAGAGITAAAVGQVSERFPAFGADTRSREVEAEVNRRGGHQTQARLKGGDIAAEAAEGTEEEDIEMLLDRDNRLESSSDGGGGGNEDEDEEVTDNAADNSDNVESDKDSLDLNETAAFMNRRLLGARNLGKRRVADSRGLDAEGEDEDEDADNGATDKSTDKDRCGADEPSDKDGAGTMAVAAAAAGGDKDEGAGAGAVRPKSRASRMIRTRAHMDDYELNNSSETLLSSLSGSNLSSASRRSSLEVAGEEEEEGGENSSDDSETKMVEDGHSARGRAGAGVGAGSGVSHEQEPGSSYLDDDDVQLRENPSSELNENDERLRNAVVEFEEFVALMRRYFRGFVLFSKGFCKNVICTTKNVISGLFFEWNLISGQFLECLPNSDSPSALLPLYPSWSLVCLGPSSIYSHKAGIRDQPNFKNGTQYLLPWDVYLMVDMELWDLDMKEILNYDTTLSGSHHHRTPRRHHLKATSGIGCPTSGGSAGGGLLSTMNREKVKLFVGFEYECPRGHRFMIEKANSPMRASSANSKEMGAELLRSEIPVWMHCTCRRSPQVSAQLMRIHIVTPKAPVTVTLDPRVQPSASPNGCIFGTGEEPIRLEFAKYYVLRLPYVYAGPQGVVRRPQEPVVMGKLLPESIRVEYVPVSSSRKFENVVGEL
ncbi:unnamed protein product [Anisakis simplex]|uniref:Nonsense-mediated mRNA decay factor SMG8 n=1 Tax=Anisakis simplex TaxID=6269 RepID=A0A0M3K1N5_ANISI|nr:unnamed protein product [Anisakis simplex]